MSSSCAKKQYGLQRPSMHGMKITTVKHWQHNMTTI